VVMTTHARTGLQRAMLGSVTEEVLRLSPVPVLAIRPGGQRVTAFKTLLVPVDGTPGGTLALGHAVALGQSLGARIVLLQVITPLPRIVFEPLVGAALTSFMDPAWEEETIESARRYVGALAERVAARGIGSEARLELGHAAEQIVDVSEQVEADMIVMSTNALTGSLRALLGSVADAVVRKSRRPVLLIRRIGEAGEEPLGGSNAGESTRVESA
jgi:nucleotide-binding universal stress UspA family protein